MCARALSRAHVLASRVRCVPLHCTSLCLIEHKAVRVKLTWRATIRAIHLIAKMHQPEAHGKRRYTTRSLLWPRCSWLILCNDRTSYHTWFEGTWIGCSVGMGYTFRGKTCTNSYLIWNHCAAFSQQLKREVSGKPPNWYTFLQVHFQNEYNDSNMI